MLIVLLSLLLISLIVILEYLPPYIMKFSKLHFQGTLPSTAHCYDANYPTRPLSVSYLFHNLNEIFFSHGNLMSGSLSILVFKKKPIQKDKKKIVSVRCRAVVRKKVPLVVQSKAEINPTIHHSRQ